MATLWQTRYGGSLIAALGAVLLPFAAPNSELMWFFAALICFVAVVALRSEERWHASIPALFVWTLIAVNLRFIDGVPGVLSVGVFYLAASALARWQVDPYVGTHPLRALVVSQAIAILLVEGLLVMYFWPINFPSRALLVTILGLLAYEVVAFQEAGTLSWRAILPSVGMGALVMAAVVRTADWFGL